MERLIDETLQRLPQVYIEPEMASVKDELEGFKDIGNRFRSVCKVSIPLIFLFSFGTDIYPEDGSRTIIQPTHSPASPPDS